MAGSYGWTLHIMNELLASKTPPKLDTSPIPSSTQDSMLTQHSTETLQDEEQLLHYIMYVVRCKWGYCNYIRWQDHKHLYSTVPFWAYKCCCVTICNACDCLPASSSRVDDKAHDDNAIHNHTTRYKHDSDTDVLYTDKHNHMTVTCPSAWLLSSWRERTSLGR